MQTNHKWNSGYAFFDFSRRATRDADRMEIQKYHGRTNGRNSGRTDMGMCERHLRVKKDKTQKYQKTKEPKTKGKGKEKGIKGQKDKKTTERQ